MLTPVTVLIASATRENKLSGVCFPACYCSRVDTPPACNIVDSYRGYERDPILILWPDGTSSIQRLHHESTGEYLKKRSLSSRARNITLCSPRPRAGSRCYAPDLFIQAYLSAPRYTRWNGQVVQACYACVYGTPRWHRIDVRAHR